MRAMAAYFSESAALIIDSWTGLRIPLQADILMRHAGPTAFRLAAISFQSFLAAFPCARCSLGRRCRMPSSHAFQRARRCSRYIFRAFAGERKSAFSAAKLSLLIIYSPTESPHHIPQLMAFRLISLWDYFWWRSMRTRAGMDGWH